MSRKNTYLIAGALLIALAAFPNVLQAADAPSIFTDFATTVQVAQRGPTHEIVCSCSCGDDTQTFAWSPGTACSVYDNIGCTTAAGDEEELDDCTAKSQEIEAVAVPHSRQ